MHKIILLIDFSEEYTKSLLRGITRYSRESGPWVFCRTWRALEKRFRQMTGLPVYKYICNLRIEKCAEKLLETDKNITEIAFETGFSDCKNISRHFRMLKGCTPNEYRKKHMIAGD
jgi:transcriptional regulator GlxA family with amidase domain